MIAITGRKAPLMVPDDFAGARGGSGYNSNGRNHSLDVRVIIVIRDIFRSATVEILDPYSIPRGNPTPKSSSERHARISNEQVYFARPIESEPSV